MKTKIIIVAGGSGGHITPALAVADEFSRAEVLFLCSRNKLDQNILENAKVNWQTIYTGKLRRYFSWENFTDFFLFLAGVWQSYFLLRKIQPEVIFSKGGYVSLPVGIAASFLKIPFVLHESDAYMGLSNRILAKVAQKVLSAFHVRGGQFIGTPVRSLVLKGDAQKADKFLNFSKNKPLIVVLGGSQGALFLNELVYRNLEILSANVVLITGEGKNNFHKTNSLRVFEFLNQEFGDVLARADLVISRSGANALAELSALKKVSILIPLPSAANNHQQKNAEVFAKKNACVLLSQESVTDEKFVEIVQDLLKHKNKREQLAQNIAQFYFANSAKKIAEELKEFI